MTKRMRTPAPPSKAHHPSAGSGRPYIPDLDYSQDWTDCPDASRTFLAQPKYGDSAGSKAKIEVTIRDRASSSKVDSKRIAHKLSEKTRRNRLTIAIREMQKLLPSEIEGADQPLSQTHKDADFVVRPGVPSSKLDVAEMAVAYIKDLKEKNKEMARRIREAEQKLAQCQCWRGREESPPDSAASPSTVDGATC
ncbi:92662e4f-c6b2-401c-99f3-ae0ab85cde88 [Thermothielavioides terrestris]|nr:92662e4f-c6b2-401c-99f3-ae0ab85cde88 [Thermothielavioides terrestris]